MRTDYCGRYTCVELITVGFSLFFLTVLLLSAVRSSRIVSRRHACNNNLRNLGLAVMNYASAQGAYPGYLGPITIVDDESAPAAARVSWVVKILPYLERTDIYRLYREPGRAAASGVDPRQVFMNVLVCPDAFEANQRRQSPPPCNYAVNTGQRDVLARPLNEGRAGYPSDWRANGVFFNHYHDKHENPAAAPLESIDQDYITEHDGSANTVMLSERIDGGSYSILPPSALDVEASLGCVWWPSVNDEAPFEPPRDSMRINGPYDPVPIHRARPSSKHVAGVNVAFCDGHAQLVSDDIDYGVWCLLQTPDGAQCNTPGKLILEPSSIRSNYGYLRSTALDESRVQ